MQKKDFEKFFRDNMKDLSLEEQEKLLIKVGRDWVPSLQQKFYKRIENSYLKCDNCKKYSLKKKFSIEVKQETEHGVFVYRDAGYGDDDEIADVTYRKFYYVCPLCGALIFKKRYFVRRENVRRIR